MNENRVCMCAYEKQECIVQNKIIKGFLNEKRQE